MAAERLQKLLAQSGLASRREAETWIEAGRVRVNGEVVRELGTKADPLADRIEVDGRPLPSTREPVVVLLHKPRGYVATVRDPHAERTVMELVRLEGRRLYPVGRLDKDTRGALLLTDDGPLAHRLLHPSHQVEKVYEVWARGQLPDDALERLSTGVELEDGVTAPARVWGVRQERPGTRFLILLREGRKRQIRRMVQALGARVDDLCRLSFGPVELGDLPEGQWRQLSRAEVEALRTGRRPPGGAHRRPARRPADRRSRRPREER